MFAGYVCDLNVNSHRFQRPLSEPPKVSSGSGPGVELYALTGGCNSLSGHSKVKIGGRKPATTGGGAHLVQGCSGERTPAQDEVLRRGGGNLGGHGARCSPGCVTIIDQGEAYSGHLATT